MSQPDDRVIDVEDRARERPDTSDNPNIPQSAQNQTHEPSDVSDSSGPIFNMYVKMAEEEDKKMTDRWQKDADGILIFAGLFSAAVAALVAVSIQDLRPTPQDTSAFYLKNILQVLADPNVSHASILNTSTEPPPFSPPTSAIWVNTLWLLSLVISLTCALLATLLQQWARRYVTITKPPRSSPHRRARTRAFFRDGVERFHLPLAVETLPTLLHVSLFLFFSGLLIFLLNINHTTFNAVVWWVGLLAVVYGCIALMPIFYHDSPYYAPLSSSAWFLYTGVSYGLLCVLSYNPFPDLFSPGTRDRFHKSVDTRRKWFLGGILKATQEVASKSSTRIDSLVLKWTLEALVEDDELERFFNGIPGFCTSDLFHDPQAILRSLGYRWFGEALHVFHTRTLTSSLLSETARERRLKVYDNAAEALDRVFLTYNNFELIFHRDKDRVLQSVQMGHFLINRFHSSDHQAAFYAHGIVAGIIATIPRAKRSVRWKTLVKDQLGISKMDLLKYLEHGDSVLLANLLHITRIIFHHALSNQHMRLMLRSILLTTSKFDIQNTHPSLRHDFCTLWNDITEEAHRLSPSRDSYHVVFSVHRIIRHLYIALHQGTESAPTDFDASTNGADFVLSLPLSYPLCTLPDHHPPSETEEITNPNITSPHDHPSQSAPVLNTVTPTASEITSRRARTLDHSPVRVAGQSTLHNVLESSSIIGSSNFQPPFNVASTNFATTSTPGPTTANVTERPTDRQIISPTVNSKSQSDPLPATGTATSVPISPLTHPTPSVDREFTTNSDVIPPSSAFGIPLSSSPVLVPNDNLPTDDDPPISLAFPISPPIEQIAPGPEPPTLPTVSFSTPLETSASQRNVPRNEVTFDTTTTHDDSQTPDLPDSDIVQSSRHPQAYEIIVMPVVDTALDRLQHPANTSHSSRDVDRPQ